MSNLWLNIRIGLYHLQIGEGHWYSVRISRNDYHKEINYSNGYFKIHTLKFPWM